jgi:RF-1 domain
MMERELLFSVTKKDLRITHFRAGGKGGQKQNKTSSGSRVHHDPSGAVGESREHREQYQNTRAAFRRMTETAEFKRWLHEMIYAAQSLPTITEMVNDAMDETKIVTQVRIDDRWVTIDPSELSDG